MNNFGFIHLQQGSRVEDIRRGTIKYADMHGSERGISVEPLFKKIEELKRQIAELTLANDEFRSENIGFLKKLNNFSIFLIALENEGIKDWSGYKAAKKEYDNRKIK